MRVVPAIKEDPARRRLKRLLGGHNVQLEAMSGRRLNGKMKEYGLRKEECRHVWT